MGSQRRAHPRRRASWTPSGTAGRSPRSCSRSRTGPAGCGRSPGRRRAARATCRTAPATAGSAATATGSGGRSRASGAAGPARCTPGLPPGRCARRALPICSRLSRAGPAARTAR